MAEHRAKPIVSEVIVVEGRYDKNTLSQVVDALIIDIGGFQVFHDRKKVALLRRLAEERGIILFTDPDGAGFVIRNYLKGTLPAGRVKQAFAPDRYGREKRKRTAGKEGKLGVEGMPPDVLLRSLRRAGATFVQGSQHEESSERPAGITKADLLDAGLIGPNSTAKRAQLIRALDLPEHLGTNALLEVLNRLSPDKARAELLVLQKSEPILP